MQKSAPSWKYGTALNALQAVNLALGGENGTVTMVNTIGWRYLSFAFRFDQIVTLFIRTEIEAPGVAIPWLSLAGVANTWMTPYDLAGPIGDNGLVAVTSPYMQLRLVCGGVGTAAAASDFSAYLCNE